MGLIAKIFVVLALLIWTGGAVCQEEKRVIPFDHPSFANEDTDWGIRPTKELSTTYHAKTPIEVPGGRTVKTVELKEMLGSSNPPIVLDVLGGDVKKRVVIPGAVFMSGAGISQMFYAEKTRFDGALERLTEGNKEKSLVFYCLSAECWLSYNAALRAIEAGYRNVLWYRGGWESWKAAGYPLVGAKPYDW